MMRRVTVFLSVLLFVGVISACETVNTATGVATSVGVATGVITEKQAGAITRGTAAVVKSFEDFTPEQEYYIGRSVAAVVLSKYQPSQDSTLNQYVNQVGQAVAIASDRPEIFNGYSFLVLESDEVNAFATPGGHIFVTKGLLRCCRTEDALAAVLAHEIGHVSKKHGLQSIQAARLTQALTLLAMEGTKAFGPGDLAKLTETFEDSISDITTTLIANGYSRSFEYQADAASVENLRRMGYNPAALMDMLTVMEKNLKPGGLDFAKTHPRPQDRIDNLKQSGVQEMSVSPPPARQERFHKALRNL